MPNNLIYLNKYIKIYNIHYIYYYLQTFQYGISEGYFIPLYYVVYYLFVFISIKFKLRHHRLSARSTFEKNISNYK